MNLMNTPMNPPVNPPVNTAPASVIGESDGGLIVKNLGKSYKEKIVLRDVSLHLERGEVVALLGPNGAGKTTCFYAVAGLVAPDRGQILIEKKRLHLFPSLSPRPSWAWLFTPRGQYFSRHECRAKYPIGRAILASHTGGTGRKVRGFAGRIRHYPYSQILCFVPIWWGKTAGGNRAVSGFQSQICLAG